MGLFDPRRRRGFTLVEMMVAVLIGGICVLLAAQVGQNVIQLNSRAREVDESLVKARLVTKQIRDDIRMTGYGSTGAIGVDNGNPTFGGLSIVTPEGGFNAIPAVFGVNNGLTGDTIQLVVPNPMTVQRTTAEHPAGAVAAGLPALTCPNNIAYISDHTAPSGAGRTQLVELAGVGATVDVLQFTVAVGAEIMCARVSTYWIDAAAPTPILRRSDLNAPAGPGTDDVAPGIVDMQIAYRVTSEAYALAGVGTGGASFWAFDGQAGDFGGSMGTPGAWFEVRNVRVNLLSRALNKFAKGDAKLSPAAEDGAVPPTTLRATHTEWISAGESLVNLRYFDLGAPSTTPAEPY